MFISREVTVSAKGWKIYNLSFSAIFIFIFIFEMIMNKESSTPFCQGWIQVTCKNVLVPVLELDYPDDMVENCDIYW